MGAKPAAMRDVIKKVPKVRGQNKKVVRTRYVVNGHGRMVWMDETGKIWPTWQVEMRPEKE